MYDIATDAASVKVMRSYDYCHFEVCLSATLLGVAADERIKAVDELRKTAARLADKAVEQYQTAKKHAEKRTAHQFERQCLEQKIELIRRISPDDRTVGQAAQLKSFEDEGWERMKAYDYEDEWNDDQDS